MTNTCLSPPSRARRLVFLLLLPVFVPAVARAGFTPGAPESAAYSHMQSAVAPGPALLWTTYTGSGAAALASGTSLGTAGFGSAGTPSVPGGNPPAIPVGVPNLQWLDPPTGDGSTAGSPEGVPTAPRGAPNSFHPPGGVGAPVTPNAGIGDGELVAVPAPDAALLAVFGLVLVGCLFRRSL